MDDGTIEMSCDINKNKVPPEEQEKECLGMTCFFVFLKVFNVKTFKVSADILEKNNNNNLHVTQFVSYGEGGAESVVLNDRTRIGAVTHGAEFGQSQRVAFLHLRIPANVFPVNSRAVSAVPRGRNS